MYILNIRLNLLTASEHSYFLIRFFSRKSTNPPKPEEEEEDDDDPEKLRKARSMDDWKDGRSRQLDDAHEVKITPSLCYCLNHG